MLSMITQRTQKIAFAASAAFAAIALVAFQAPQQKLGIVDVSKLFNESDFAKGQQDKLRKVGVARTTLLQTMDDYRTLTVEQAQNLRKLSLLPSPKPEDTASLDSLKAEIAAGDKKYKDLQVKANPTPAEVSALQEYSARERATLSLSRRWAQEFDDEVKNLNESLNKETIDHIKQGLKKVGADKGYTLIFSQDVAPYGANDLTADVLKAMNSQKGN